MNQIAAFILFLPFVSFLLILLLPEKNRAWAGWLACAGIFVSFLLSAKLFWAITQDPSFELMQTQIPWIGLPHLQLELGILVDRLSVLMLLVVTGVGSAVFYYSLEYMSHDEGFRRYFAGLSLFAFSMIGIVVSNNLLQLFIFWELVGLSSYLLIGHWYQKPEAADAGKKAFLTNRVGDFGFLLGILVLWTFSGPLDERTLNLLSLNHLLPGFVSTSSAHQWAITAAMLLIFTGIMGKSAQFPLHVWLPDAMEGPTPVSALIHAATMVAAGVYLLARLFPLLILSPDALRIIAYLGGFTALFSATQAIVQKDIKRILAYSTLSQLGYMVMAIGLGNPSVGMYHLTTHAFFKALLFLGAGSIIHAVHKQDIFQMGGLFKELPVTSICFFIGTYALIGFWPASGFFSKDEVLALAFGQNKILFVTSAFTVFLTALYMGRLIWTVFFGSPKTRKKLHESGNQMTLPLIVLAFLSLAGGFLGIERFLHGLTYLHEAKTGGPVILIATSLGILGILCSFLFYQFSEKQRTSFRNFFSPIYVLLERKYFIDDAYNFLLQHVQQPFARFLSWFEKKVVVEGMINQTALATAAAGEYSRKIQTGKVQTYITVFLAGIVILIYFFVLKHSSS